MRYPWYFYIHLQNHYQEYTNIINSNVECKVEVVMSLECQEWLIATGHTGTGVNKLSEAAGGHFGRDKLYNLLSQCYLIPMLLDRVRMFIKYY